MPDYCKKLKVVLCMGKYMDIRELLITKEEATDFAFFQNRDAVVNGLDPLTKVEKKLGFNKQSVLFYEIEDVSPAGEESSEAEQQMYSTSDEERLVTPAEHECTVITTSEQGTADPEHRSTKTHRVKVANPLFNALYDGLARCFFFYGYHARVGDRVELVEDNDRQREVHGKVSYVHNERIYSNGAYCFMVSIKNTKNYIKAFGPDADPFP